MKIKEYKKQVENVDLLIEIDKLKKDKLRVEVALESMSRFISTEKMIEAFYMIANTKRDIRYSSEEYISIIEKNSREAFERK